MATPSRIIGVVPARAGSKGLPGKNLALLSGKPLYGHAIDAGLDAGLDEVVVSTDIPEILSAPARAGMRVVRRPVALAQDDTPMAAVLMDLLTREVSGDAIIVLLQPTSPLRRATHIRETLNRYMLGDASLAMTVVRADNGALKSGLIQDGFLRALRRNEDLFTNRQALPPLYRPNGAVYVFSASSFRTLGGFPAHAIATVEMSADDSADIDTAQDLCDAEAQLRKAGPTV